MPSQSKQFIIFGCFCSCTLCLAYSVMWWINFIWRPPLMILFVQNLIINLYSLSMKKHLLSSSIHSWMECWDRRLCLTKNCMNFFANFVFMIKFTISSLIILFTCFCFFFYIKVILTINILHNSSKDAKKSIFEPSQNLSSLRTKVHWTYIQKDICPGPIFP